MSDEYSDTRARVRRMLQEQFERVDSPEAADEIARRLEELAADETEAEAGERAERDDQPAAERMEHARRREPSRESSADVFVEAAEQSAAPTGEAEEVVEAAQEAAGVHEVLERPEAARGRELLKEAVVRRMGPIDALDTRVFLALNGFPHPRWSDTLANLVSVTANGGWIWVLGVFGANLLGVPKSWRTLEVIVPTMAAVTLTVENPVKSFFRRRRPFIDVVRAVVVGKRPGSWSFPSGHTATSFAGAWVVSSTWRRQSPIFFGLASLVGFSRIYVGAHYPGDVLCGMLFGITLGDLFRRLSVAIVQAARGR